MKGKNFKCQVYNRICFNKICAVFKLNKAKWEILQEQLQFLQNKTLNVLALWMLMMSSCKLCAFIQMRVIKNECNHKNIHNIHILHDRQDFCNPPKRHNFRLKHQQILETPTDSLTYRTSHYHFKWCLLFVHTHLNPCKKLCEISITNEIAQENDQGMI